MALSLKDLADQLKQSFVNTVGNVASATPIGQVFKQVPQYQQALQSFGQNYPNAGQAVVNTLQPVQQRLQTPLYKVNLPTIKTNNLDLRQKIGATGYNYIAKPMAEGLINFPAQMQAGIAQTGGYLGQAQQGNWGRPQDLLSGIGQLGEGILNGSILPGGIGIAENAVKSVGYNTLKGAIKQGAISGAKYVGAFSLSQALQSNKDQPLDINYFKNILGETAKGAGTGAVLGGTLSGASYGVGKVVNLIANKIKATRQNISPEQLARETKAQFENEVRRVLGKKQDEPIWVSDIKKYYETASGNTFASTIPSKKYTIEPQVNKNNKVTEFYTLNNVKDKNGYVKPTYIKAEGAKLIDISPKIKTFISKDELGNWTVSEATTGMSISNGGYPTLKGAIDSAKSAVVDYEKAGKSIKDLVEQQSKRFGNSPYSNITPPVVNPVQQTTKAPEVKNQSSLAKITTPETSKIQQQKMLLPTTPSTLDFEQQMTSLQKQKQKILPQQEQEILQSQSNLSNNQLNKNTLKDYSYNVKDKLYTEYIDRFNPISKLAKLAGKDKEIRGRLAQYYGTGSTADYHLQNELSPILKDTNVTDLKDAAIAMRDVELAGRKIQGSPLQNKAQEVLKKLQSKYGDNGMTVLGEKLKQLYAYQDKIAKEYLVDTGIMSPESYAKMRSDNNFYIPFKRVSDKLDEFLGIPIKKGAGSVGSQNVIYKIKGSDKELIDPIESIVENTYKMVSLGQRQKVAQTIANISKELPDIVKKTNISNQQNTISVFENGKKVFYSVPPEVADAARGMSEESLITLTKILKVPTDLFRTMTTGINPEFALPNIARDTQSALFNAGLNPLKWIAGLAHYAKRDDVYRDFLKSGARTARVSLNRPYLKQTAEELAKGEFNIAGIKVNKGLSIKSPSDIMRGLEMLSQYSEQPTRVAVFKDALSKALKSGMSKEEALREAAYWSQEGTVNFARRGSKMSNINAIYAYLNARTQGVDRMFRTMKEQPTQALARFGFGLLAPSLALYAWNSSNPKYYDDRIVSKRDKQDNFIFMLPNTIYGVDYLKLPKSEIAKVVNPVENFLDFSRNKGGDVWGSIANTIQSFSPIDNWGGVIPTAINPLVETSFNKDFYSGYDIVPDYKKNLPAGYQDSPYTSPLFRMVGRKTNLSPALIQNLVESYGGGMSRIAEMASQPFIPNEYKTAKNTQGAEINRTPILRRFMGGEKRTVEEQSKADISKQNAIQFNVNDIKGAINRGDIPVVAGIKKIQELRGVTSTQPLNTNSDGSIDLGSSVMYQDSKTGKWKEVQKSDIEKATIDSEYSLQSDRLKRTDNFNGWVDATEKYITELKNRQSKLNTTYEKAEINSIQNKIEDLQTQVEKYKGYGGFKKGKAPKKISVKKITAPKIKSVSFKSKKFKALKLSAPKAIKSGKVKGVKAIKVKPIKIAKLKGLNGSKKLV